MKKYDWNFALKSIVLFVFSFLAIHGLLILVKIIIAWSTGIQYIWDLYHIVAVSPSTSEVWTEFNVKLFYGSDIVILLLFVVTPILLFFRYSYFPSEYNPHLFWFFITALFTLVGNVASGIITQTNTYHFFNWMYLSYTSMMFILISVILVAFLIGYLYMPVFFAFYKYPEDYENNIYRNFIHFVTGMILPFAIGLFVLYLPHIAKLSETDLIVIAAAFIVPGSGIMFIWQFDNNIDLSGSNAFPVRISLVCLALYIISLVIF